MKLNEKNKIGLILLFGIGLLVYSVFKDNRENELLNNSKSQTAVIIEIFTGGSRGSSGANIQYTINNKKFENEVYGNFSKNKIGDTVDIIYSVKDPSISRVINKKI